MEIGFKDNSKITQCMDMENTIRSKPKVIMKAHTFREIGMEKEKLYRIIMSLKVIGRMGSLCSKKILNSFHEGRFLSIYDHFQSITYQYSIQMQQKVDRLESEQFSQIINPNGVDIKLFAKACQEQDIESVIQFILSLQKILKLYDKPSRTNPLTCLTPQNLQQIIDKLKTLQERLKWTIYELKVSSIIETIQKISTSNNKVTKSKEEDQQTKRILNTIKVEQVLSNPSVLNGKFVHGRKLYEFVINQILPQAGRQILSINDHQKRYEAVLKGLQLCNYIIHPTQIEIQISKNTLLESRVFKMKYQSMLQATQISFLRKSANIINQAILCPSDQKIQALLLKILKRMYKLWGQIMHGPLYLNLRNISLFFSEETSNSKMIKEAAIFCYLVINSKLDIKFGDMLSSSQQLKDIKRNEYFSSKGLALPYELGLSYDTTNLDLPIWKYRLHLDKREKYVFPVLIQKSNTMLYWKFQVLSYDIGFCIYKVGSLKKYNPEEYDKNQDCKPIVKMAKYGNGTPNSKMPVKGQTFLKSGLYYVIFDNSHSMVRGKEILVEICQLEASL